MCYILTIKTLIKNDLVNHVKQSKLNIKIKDNKIQKFKDDYHVTAIDRIGINVTNKG
jgi:hypothetical protein